MKKTVLVLLVLVSFIVSLLTGCSSLMQTGSVSRAYEAYEEQDYQKTLEMISFSQKLGDVTPELNAELNYLKAQTYAQLGMTEKSDNLFRHLGEEHKDTEYGSLAYAKMNQSKSAE